MIKQALDAMDKATAGPWEVLLLDDDIGNIEKIYVRKNRKIVPNNEAIANCKLIHAAPDMAAWIKKALPYMKFARACVGAGLISTNKAYDEKELDALIKEATE